MGWHTRSPSRSETFSRPNGAGIMKKQAKSAAKGIRLLIVDQHPVTSRGLREILADDGWKFTCAEAFDGNTAMALVKEQPWDLIVLDIFLTEFKWLDLFKEMRHLQPGARILAFSSVPEEEYEISALRAGATGYLPKTSSPEEIIRAVHKVTDGGTFVSPGLVTNLVEVLNSHKKPKPHEALSQRESQIFRGLVQGQSMKEIGSDLKLSPKTISTYRSRICAKLHADSNAAIVRYAMKHKLM
jgi:two-component system, NarL family, invasion response regulator UvrY